MDTGKKKPALLLASPEARAFSWVFPFLLGGFIFGCVAFIVTHRIVSQSTSHHRGESFEPPAETVYPSLAELAVMSDEELSGQDIALLNLRCAEGLPGAEDLNPPQCMQTIDAWANHVRFETNRHLYKFRERPEEFQNSEAYFRMLTLITVLQQDFGVHYHAERIRDVDFTNSQDLFIHGMVGNDNGGTCVSMPVLYTTVARRLGYPVYLVTAKSHLFARWQDEKERINIEATGQGLSTFDDAYYLHWPVPITKAEAQSGEYLKSLTPAEELAVFLAARGHCLEDNGRLPEARVCYAQALERRPDSRDYFSFLAYSLGFRRRPVPHQQLAKQQPGEVSIESQNADDPLAVRSQQTPRPVLAPPSAALSPHSVMKPTLSDSSGPPLNDGNSSPNVD